MANSATYNHTKIHFAEGSAPTTPDTGEWVVYAKTTGLFVMDDAGVEYGPFGSGDAAAHIADAADAHDASAISVLDAGGNYTGTDVEAVLAEIKALIDAGGGGSGGSYTIDAIATTVATEVTPTGTVVWSDGVDGLNGRDILSAKYNGMTADDVSCQLIPIGAATQIETAFRAVAGVQLNYNMVGPCFTNGTANTSGIVWGRWNWGTALAGGGLFLTYGGTITAVNVSTHDYSAGIGLGGPMGLIFIRLTMVAANTWRMEFGLDGVTWSTFGVADLSHTFTPTHMGVAVSNFGGGTADRFATFEYFKHNG